MAFGDVYGYKTNAKFVVAQALSDEYEVVVDDGDNYDAVDLVLVGFANGQRLGVPVYDVDVATPLANAPVNVAVAAADVVQDGPLRVEHGEVRF